MIAQAIGLGLLAAGLGWKDYVDYVRQPPPNVAEEAILMRPDGKLRPVLPSDLDRLRKPPVKKKP